MFDPAPDVSADFVVLESLVRSASNGPLSRSLMGFMRQIISCADWRSVAVKLPRDRSRVTIKGARDLAYFMPLAFEN